jgi:hypothetical protein
LRRGAALPCYKVSSMKIYGMKQGFS